VFFHIKISLYQDISPVEAKNKTPTEISIEVINLQALKGGYMANLIAFLYAISLL
jgi:hypothetical protein